MEEFTRLLDAGCGELGIVLTEKQKEQFFKYFQLLTEWNQVMNLTAITEMPEVVTKHFVDSLLVVNVFDGIRTEAYSCIQITLLDSLNKRVGFLNTVIQELGLTGITAVHGRAEDFGRNKEYREQFDLCVSRAVANLSTLSEYCLPFVKAGGEFLPYKSGKVEEEAREAESAVKKLGGSMRETKTLVLPGTDVDRTFVPIDKINMTPKKYPRKAGMPGKEPLK